MARRRPARVRAELPRHPRTSTDPRRGPQVSGIPAGALRHIARLEQIWPEENIATALRDWSRIAHRRHPQAHDCYCCLDPRLILELALHRLPPSTARRLRVRVEVVDEEFRRRTSPNVFAPPDWPWWHRRL